ncbi:MAG: BatD family protein [Saprospiraceae bacterium]|jgi:hypothetical protein
MKYLNLLFFLCLGFCTQAQSFSVQLSSDSILLGNSFRLNFTIEDSQAEFEAPDFEGMHLISGPNYKSSVQIINGDMKSKKSISFLLRPERIGQFFIPPAYLVDEDLTLETEALELNVYPNPEGIIEGPPVMENNFIFDSFNWPEMPHKMAEPKKKKSKSKKPLRKI